MYIQCLLILEAWKICPKCQKRTESRGPGRRIQEASSFICFSSGICWQECEETDNGYASCNGAIYSVKLEGLSVSMENMLDNK